MGASRLSDDHYEAIVVGSGFGGAVAACRLAQAGVSVAVLERGRRYGPAEFPRPRHGRHDLMDWRRGGPYDVRPLNDVLVVQARAMGTSATIAAAHPGHRAARHPRPAPQEPETRLPHIRTQISV